MYRPKAFGITERDDLLATIERSGFGQLVSHGPEGFTATGLPFLVARDDTGADVLRGHVARANRQWKMLDGADVLVLFQLADGYVTPAWYPSKAEHGEVVPTWNYTAAQVHGTATAHDDAEWVRRLVTQLTDHHESSHDGRAAVPRWAVSDAPDEFVDRQLRGIVGVEVEIERVEGSRKLSQNRSVADRAGVVAGLDASSDPADRALANEMRAADAP